MTEQKQEPQPPPPPPRVVFSGLTQVAIAAIGAVATISGALIASSSRGGHDVPIAGQTASPSPPVNNNSGHASVPPPTPTVVEESSDDSTADDTSIDYTSMMGHWRGARVGSTATAQITENDDGSVQVISQAQTPNGTASSEGRGQISGNTLRWDFTSDANMSGRCAAQMSEDGHQLQGSCQFSDGSTGPVMMMR